ncbi:TetR/AcrR family transcriptional regulator [Mycolicibacterium bacteremicum]|uniref:TetR family transcriptional regulator n=1 Tax=Mycolicibacterium bacteremicum TaxID=564198 RepID=A0A1W9YRE7_MYCBA|nr:TetR family transcriptional regulator [Mycolicibacterium bacteremicum]MCV7433546.1 helix-turn-helix transcriptional regulator [Mycolicibacterium bacteremicum]ORA02614.1 TetR family transcriptional regulator [Mycolicibacterium bacteremicum]
MAARTHSADPRAERVRTLLHEAAFALAHEHPVDELTVATIVGRAGVSRQVFYQHFRDRDDAVAAAFAVAFEQATADIGDDPRVRIMRLFDFAGEHREMYRNVIPSAVTQRVVSAFRAELAPACADIAAQGMSVIAPVSGLTVEAVTRFLVGGFMEVLRSWMEEPDNRDARDLRDRVAAAFDTVNALLTLPGRN